MPSPRANRVVAIAAVTALVALAGCSSAGSDTTSAMESVRRVTRDLAARFGT